MLLLTIKTFIKIILNKSRLYSTYVIYYDLNVKTFNYIYEEQTVLFMFNVNFAEYQLLYRFIIIFSLG